MSTTFKTANRTSTRKIMHLRAKDPFSSDGFNNEVSSVTVVVYIIRHNNSDRIELEFSSSICHPNDQFCRSTGVEIASHSTKVYTTIPVEEFSHTDLVYHYMNTLASLYSQYVANNTVFNHQAMLRMDTTLGALCEIGKLNGWFTEEAVFTGQFEAPLHPAVVAKLVS